MKPQPKTVIPDAHRAATEVAAAESAYVLAYHIDEMVRAAAALDVRPRRSSFWRSWSWLVLTLTALVAYALAVHYERDRTFAHRLLDGLKLFPSGWPGYDPSARWQYTLAKHLAALVSAFVTLRVLAALFAERWAELRARWRRRHVVVCGLGETGLRSALAFRAARSRVTCLDTAASGSTAEDARDAGALVLRRDATDVAALRDARVDRARAVVCAAPDDATNTRIASLATALAEARSTKYERSIYVHIEDPDLAQLLRAPLASFGSARLHFFNMSSVWARVLLDDPRGPFAALGAVPPRVAVFGSTDVAAAVVVGAAQRWHAHVRKTGVEGRATVVLVAPTAADVCVNLARRYPAIARVCDLVPVAEAAVTGRPLPAELTAANVPSAVYACVDDHSANLALALEMEHRLGAPPVFLPAAASAAEIGPFLLTAGLVCAVALPADGQSLDLLHDQMREPLARLVHETYVAGRRREKDFGDRPADCPWEELREEYRRSNRAHVDGMLAQLRAVWFEIEPMDDWDETALSLESCPEAVEAMAELEHQRWARERHAEGWHFGPRRLTRRNELLIPWTELPERERERDREFVRERPALLAQAGFRLVRDGAREELARRLHDEYIAAPVAEGEIGPHGVPWDKLPETARNYNRTAVDHIAVKLARIGCRAVPRVLVPRPKTSFTEGELEQMAELEHERWLAERQRAGWSLGSRNDEARTHPSLVPWADLPEGERNKDREVVVAIPGLLASVGWAIVQDAEG